MIKKEIIFAGFGGQGILTAGKFLSFAAMDKGFNVSWLPSYGPEMRGGTANCSVIISDEEVGSPVISEADIIVVMNKPSLDKFSKSLKKNGVLEPLFDKKTIISISVGLIALMFVFEYVYEYILLRYIILIIMVIILYVKKSYFINLIKTIKNK